MSTFSDTPERRTGDVSTRSTPRWRLPVLLALGFALGLALVFGAVQLINRTILAPSNLNGLVLQSPQSVSDFTLAGADGPVRLSDFRGQVVLVYFGYTYCPDVCPSTLSKLKQARAALGRDAEQVQVLMVSVDPVRDTPEHLATYMAFFDPSFVGVTGSQEELLAASTPFGVYFEKQEGTAATGYLVDHTASVALVDQKGHLRLFYPFGTAAEEIASDLEYFVR